ncbi:MAG: TlpA disulfide reductase family protein [Polyangiaceae bacterium]|nr:TlpA disulfide reductase family protein [Polyangiaceae bacterium]
MPAPTATEPKKPAKARVPVCSRESTGDPFPDQALVRITGSSGRTNEKPRIGGGRWTWVNLWAAWCAPCKEELPRLIRWQKSLGFRLHTISVDDDERQLRTFLSDSSGPLEASYWLPEGAPREEWLKSVGIAPDPELPVQLLFNPKGKLRCVIQGAVEDQDLPRVTELVQ